MTKTRWQACNVLGLEAAGPRLWQVTAGGGRFSLSREESLQEAAALNPKVVAKDWNELVKPRLNLSLLPPTQVFLRVVQLPKTEDYAETISMLEFQLEKLSPLPVGQIAWTFELVPSRALSETQTAILVVVSLQRLEEHLGKLEAAGFLADRVELPFIDQLLALEINRDCALLFPFQAEEGSMLWVAWWYGGALRSIGQVHLPSGEDPGEVIRGQLAQMAWAGELEGWLTGPPRYYLVADELAVLRWKPVLEGRLDPPAEVVPAAAQAALATLAAKRASQADPRVGLLPKEFTARYRQQWIDRLWMQGLFGLLALYVFGLLAYFGITAFKGYQLDSLQTQEIAQANAYTNAIRLHDQVKVLQEQVSLQFAALNCYLVAATNLPTELVLESLNFDRGSKVILYGNGGPEAAPKVFDYNAALKAAKVNDQPLFKLVEGPTVNMKPGGAQIGWNFSCELRKVDFE
ncbi:MAG TPA: hypothetical protein DCM86_02075 [Verrucomicrobiales bacterium]|nr:hypothetical protein [Verrucomicrobiales bacterium]